MNHRRLETSRTTSHIYPMYGSDAIEHDSAKGLRKYWFVVKKSAQCTLRIHHLMSLPKKDKIVVKMLPTTILYTFTTKHITG